MKSETKICCITLISFLNSKNCNKKPMDCLIMPPTGNTGHSLTFSCACLMDATIFEWDFGDGTAVSTGAIAKHAYSIAGKYTVKLMVMDKKGEKMHETTKTIAIN